MPILEFVRDEIRAREEIAQQPCAHNGKRQAQAAALFYKVLAELAAQDIRAVFAQPLHDAGVEAFQTIRPFICIQHAADRLTQGRGISAACF